MDITKPDDFGRREDWVIDVLTQLSIKFPMESLLSDLYNAKEPQFTNNRVYMTWSKVESESRFYALHCVEGEKYSTAYDPNSTSRIFKPKATSASYRDAGNTGIMSVL